MLQKDGLQENHLRFLVIRLVDLLLLNDITFGTQTDETAGGANDGICEIVTTNLGAGI